VAVLTVYTILMVILRITDLVSCNIECASCNCALIVGMVKVSSSRVPVYFVVSGSLNKWWNGGVLWTLGIETCRAFNTK